MLILLTEPSNFRYIYINPATNRVHLLVPFIAGVDVSTDNTCKKDVEVNAFFQGGAFDELDSYKRTLEFHFLLLEENNPHYQTKKERLEQINLYLEAIVGMRDNYKTVVNTFLSKPSNLYSIQLRPEAQDHMSHVVNPVFTINRGNDSRGASLSPLYNKMHEVFPSVVLGKTDPQAELIQKVLDALPSNASFEAIQDVLASQYGVPNDFFKKRLYSNRQEQTVDRAYVDNLMGFDAETTSHEYVEALLGLCAPNLQNTLEGSPFYFDSSSNISENAERLSMLTQFYLGVLNVYCCTKGISNKNFGVILDSSSSLSQELINIVAGALNSGKEVEPAIIAFFNRHKNEFKLTRELNSQDKDAVVQKFETTYRTVTATKENPHMDDFMFLDTEAQGEHDIFFTNKGLICTDAANILPTTPKNGDYLAEIRREARMHRDIATPQDKPVITINIEPEALIDKLSDVQLERLPKEVVDLPVFKLHNLLNDVAKGKQYEACVILYSSEDKQTLLRTPGKLTDYSGRTFHCTAYEYAYWAKDTHMQRMLESHMDDETKTFMLEKIDVMEQVGLSYQQHGITYQNAHYDMSFVLKNLNDDEFRQLQTMVGQRNPKIQQITVDNYKNTSFTATEYESLKKSLEQHWPQRIFSLFYSSRATAISEKLQFDFHSLITALDACVTNFEKKSYQELLEDWMKVGKAQRDVPAHIAHEYCNPMRSFKPLPSFNERGLHRILDLHVYIDLGYDISWFPLSSSSSGLGFDFAVLRGYVSPSGVETGFFNGRTTCLDDVLAIRHLEEVRIADLTLSRENLSRPASQLGLVH